MNAMKNVRIGLTNAFSIVVLSLFLFQFPAMAANLPDFTKLVEKNGPAVVNISTTQKIKRSHPTLPPGMDIPDEGPLGDLFRHFFGEEGEGREFKSQSLGSGFIISADGYILTNNHVVDHADEIIVRLSDRRELKAKLVGHDKRSDIALLKVDADNLPVAKIGHSSELKVGEWVLAIGSPFGFEQSVSVGVVSAIGRSLPSENYVPFIQTDVAINPGNSGGPLFNLEGEVVGINSQIYSRTGGFMGLSFAIPIDMAMDIVDQLKTKGTVSRGWLGVLIQNVTRDLAESFGMDKPMGALISRVLPDSPAANAGLEVGDVIVEFNGTEVYYSSDLPPLVGRVRPGTTAKVKIVRNGKMLTKKVKIEELPGEEELELSSAEPSSRINNRLKAVIANLSDEQRKEMKLDKQGGVLIKKVQEGPAKEAGLRAGDVILMINNVKVKDTAQLKGILKKLPENKAIPLLVQRRGNPLFLALTLGGEEKKEE